MSEALRMWVEIIFNLLYLVVIWVLVVLMSRRMGELSGTNAAVANRFRWAFFLLALGDSGHLGFRILAYNWGGLAQNSLLIDLGTVATSVTVTLFYAVMLDAWRLRFGQRYGWFEYFLLALVPVRFIVMALPQNDWGNPVTPVFWGPFRNLFLIALGLGVFYLYLRDSIRSKDRLFRWIAYMILFSYLFFIPVVFFASAIPLLGLLMIPKTVMYVVIAFLTYYGLWPRPKTTLAVSSAD